MRSGKHVAVTRCWRVQHVVGVDCVAGDLDPARDSASLTARAKNTVGLTTATSRVIGSASTAIPPMTSSVGLSDRRS